jgi:uncharacterized membrane protein
MANKKPFDGYLDRKSAQQRSDRIHAFREELQQLQKELSLDLSIAQQQAIDTHHEALLLDLEQHFDVDTTSHQKQMSLGMRIVSFLGALALAASVVFFFYRIWGLISISGQVLVLVGTPILAVIGLEFSRKREKTPHFSSLIGLVAFAAFVLDLHLLGTIFNVTPSQNAFLIWGAFALVLAYGYNLWLLQVCGILSLLAFLSATIGTWNGLYWLSFGLRPENFLPVGLLFFLIPMVIPHSRHPDFPTYYRVLGLLTVLMAVLILSHHGNGSYLHFPNKDVETFYQLLGFFLASLTIWIGIRWEWSLVTNLGGTFFVIDLYTKFFDWWWDWMPRYQFFFIVGIISILILIVFQRFRRRFLKESLA